MSYRTFKRFLGETNLERKCRWWFGISLAVLLSLTFYGASMHMEYLLYRQAREMGRELVRAAWTSGHAWLDYGIYKKQAVLNSTEDSEADEQPAISPDSLDRDDFYTELIKSGQDLGREFSSYAILPEGSKATPSRPGDLFPAGPPEDEIERALLKRFAHSPAVTEAGEQEDPDTEAEPPFYDRRVPVGDNESVYQYYQPIYAKQSCVTCHQVMGKSPRLSLKEGDLLAVMRITTSQQPIVEAIARNRSILWSVAVAIGFVSMFLLYFIVRYVIVKPVKHLRDVSNAVREGDVAQRAEIQTGDEFEELAAAFNRMLRQLLRQQDELRKVNGELDAKLDQLAQANMRLFELNRLKSDFLATMSHELRTPLNSIIGFSDVLRTIESLDDRQKRYVDNILRSGKILLDMINDILDLAKMESGRMDIRPTDFRVETVLGAQCDMARPLTEKKNIDLECQFEEDLPPLHQDQSKVQQILSNLLSNAIKFTPEGGRIVVAAERVHDRLRLEVRDTGVGISESEQALVFEKFRQGTAAVPGGDAMTREYSGTGLGLSIVRELCRLLGGEVTLRSTVGRGSTFTVELPWRAEERADLDARLKDEVAIFNQSHAAELIRKPEATLSSAGSVAD